MTTPWRVRVRIPVPAAQVEGIVHEGSACLCPRCRRVCNRLLAFVRSVDDGIVTFHCGCLTQAERSGVLAVQTYDGAPEIWGALANRLIDRVM